jgi:gamma-glutamyltranspeptidase/glutathione hydrolase
MPLQQAIEAPKFSSEHFPGFFHPHDFFLKRLRIEETVGAEVLEVSSTSGHEVDPGAGVHGRGSCARRSATSTPA